MRFILKALLSLAVVGVFMPDAGERGAGLPEFRIPALETDSTGDLCERSESLCEAAAESAVLAEVALAVAQSGAERALEAWRESREDTEES